MSVVVTVIIPSYNHGDYIEDAIESVLSQTCQDFELIVVDDGSVDGTRQVLNKYSNDSRIRIILNAVNRGQGAVINQALKFAKGRYVCFLPSDDWFLPDKLAAQLDKFSVVDDSVGVVYSKGMRFYTDTNELLPVDLPMYRGDVLLNLITEPNFVYPVTPMFRRECFEMFPFDESYIAEGEAIYLKLATVFKFDFVDSYLAVMRDHSRNTGKVVGAMYAENVRYWTEFFLMDSVPEYARRYSKIPLVRTHRLKGIEAVMLEKDFALGRRALCRAIKLKPSLVFDRRVIVSMSLSILPRVVSEVFVDFWAYRRRRIR